MSLICKKLTPGGGGKHFHMNAFAWRLVLTQRKKRTRKWLISENGKLHEKSTNLLLIACLQSMLASGSIRNNSQTWVADMIVSSVFTTFIFRSTTATTKTRILSPGQTESQVDASWKLGGYLRHRLASACVHLRWLAMTCAHFGRDQICTQVEASFSPFCHPTQVNVSWVTLSTNEIQDMSALKWVFLRLACTCEETCEFVWPPNASLYPSSICVHLRLFAGPFGPGFKERKSAGAHAHYIPFHS